MSRMAMLVGLVRRRAGWPGVFLLPILLAASCTAPLVPDPAVRYIAFGDSTTAGKVSTQYWQYVQRDLGLPAEAFAGQGHGGESVADGLSRLRDLLDRGIYPNAKVLLFWEGGNDILRFVKEHDPLVTRSPDQADYPFQTDLNSALDQIQGDIEQAIAAGSGKGLKVYVATYFDVVPGQCKAALLGVLSQKQAQLASQYVVLLNDRIRLATTDGGATVVDVATLSPQLSSDPAHYVNCDHLSDRGNRLVADLFVQVIQATDQ